MSSGHANLLEQKRVFTEEKSSPTRLELATFSTSKRESEQVTTIGYLIVLMQFSKPHSCTHTGFCHCSGDRIIMIKSYHYAHVLCCFYAIVQTQHIYDNILVLSKTYHQEPQKSAVKVAEHSFGARSC